MNKDFNIHSKWNYDKVKDNLYITTIALIKNFTNEVMFQVNELEVRKLVYFIFISNLKFTIYIYVHEIYFHINLYVIDFRILTISKEMFVIIHTFV